MACRGLLRTIRGMPAPDWYPTPTDVAGLVADRNLPAGVFTNPVVDAPGTQPTASWVQGRIDAVAARVAGFATTVYREAIAAEYVLYTVAADVDAGWNAGRQIDQYTRSTEYRRQAAALLSQLTDTTADAGSGGAGAGSPVSAFPAPQIPDNPLW